MFCCCEWGFSSTSLKILPVIHGFAELPKAVLSGLSLSGWCMCIVQYCTINDKVGSPGLEDLKANLNLI